MNLFTEFPSQAYDQWRASVEQELKGLAFDQTLIGRDEIENVTFNKFETTTPFPTNKSLNYTRANRSSSNSWRVGKKIQVKDERVANKISLRALNQGADSLTFVLQKKNIHWPSLFEDISLNYIAVQFETLDEVQALELRGVFHEYCANPLVLLNDPIGKLEKLDIPNDLKAGQPIFNVNAFGLHQAGANASEETSYALAAGHEYLSFLINKGFSVDDAAAMIRFTFGIGANYFMETSKFRVFRKLWSNVVAAYQPKENCSHACFIYAQTGFVNKSLQDPYTNLLRQTTETMSAVLGGVNEVVVLPYDEYAQEKGDELSERMALNISNILVEESYFDKVIDPLGGSYNLESLTNNLGDGIWSDFQKIEKVGGISTSEGKQIVVASVLKTAAKRIEKFQSGERMLIGVNKYFSPNENRNTWEDLPPYLGLPALILEKHRA